MRLLLIICFGITSSAWAKEKTLYFNKIFGHLHVSPNRYSSSHTTLSCGHPCVIDSKANMDDWYAVKIGPHQGYIHSKFLQESRPECFQMKYPRFFNAVDLDLTDLHYWGRLYDQYEVGKSEAQ